MLHDQLIGSQWQVRTMLLGAGCKGNDHHPVSERVARLDPPQRAEISPGGGFSWQLQLRTTSPALMPVCSSFSRMI
jgi:hypothetical protein